MKGVASVDVISEVPNLVASESRGTNVASPQMWAYQLVNPGSLPRWNRVPVPEPGPGEVVVCVEAAGLCHSDLTMMDLAPEEMHLSLPMTLGHECAGTVSSIGEGVDQRWLGERVAVFGPWGCGQCRACLDGEENYCARSGTLYSEGEGMVRPPGGGRDGALAEFMLVPNARHLVPVGELSMKVASPLTDAGTTSYHAIRRVLSVLSEENDVAVVIGLGGLGHLALQILGAESPAKVVAVDSSPEAAQHARDAGAQYVAEDLQSAKALVDSLTNGQGAQAVIDFVCVPSTKELTLAVSGSRTLAVLVGLGGADLPVGFRSVPRGFTAMTTRWGALTDLQSVIRLAQLGAVRPNVKSVLPEDTADAYARLRKGQQRGRAVVDMRDISGLGGSVSPSTDR